MPKKLTPVRVFIKVAMSADTGSRAGVVARDWASRDGLRAALLLPERVLGWILEVMSGVVAALHRQGECLTN